MRQVALAALLSVSLGGGFGDASTEIISVEGDSMLVSISVEVEVSADAVVALLSNPGDESLRLPLLDRGGGVFGIQTEVRRVDYRVVFEILGPEPARSDPVSLSDMGADFSAGDGSDSANGSDDDGGTEFSSETRRWGWLALALAAGSLAVLAFWVLGGTDDESGDANAQAGTDDGTDQDSTGRSE